MDGALIANALVALKTGVRKITERVDVFSFRGTKNRMMIGKPYLSQKIRTIFNLLRKQGLIEWRNY